MKRGKIGRLFALLLFVGTGSCGSESGRVYNNNDLELLTSYAAKEICSCIFVMGQSDDFCGAWTKAAPDLKTWTVDRATGAVDTQAGLFWSAHAQYTGRRHGCVLK